MTSTATAATAAIDATATQAFIQRWQHNTASELATAQSFVMDLCALLGVERPHPTPEQTYMFERPVTFAHGDGSTSAGRIDCYRRGHRPRPGCGRAAGRRQNPWCGCRP